MQPYTNYDLILNLLVVIVMPLLILANLKGWTKSPMNLYLWREQPTLMKVSLVICGLLSLFALVQLAGYAGLISGSTSDTVMVAIGVPFLLLALAEIWLSVRALRQWLRSRGRTA